MVVVGATPEDDIDLDRADTYGERGILIDAQMHETPNAGEPQARYT
jgi:hypothetical protein